MILILAVLTGRIDWLAKDQDLSAPTTEQKYVANRVRVGDRVYRTWRLSDHSAEEHTLRTVMALIDSQPKVNFEALEE